MCDFKQIDVEDMMKEAGYSPDAKIYLRQFLALMQPDVTL